MTTTHATRTTISLLTAVCFGTVAACSSDPGDDGDEAPTTTGDAASTEVVATEGGTVQSADGRLTLEIPPGALAEDTTITITPVDVASLSDHLVSDRPGTVAYRLEPAGLQFDAPVLVDLRADDIEPSAVDGGFELPLVGVFTLDADGTTHDVGPAPASAGPDMSIEDDGVHVRGTLEHFTTYVMSRGPLTFSITTPDVARIGSSVEVTIEICNAPSDPGGTAILRDVDLATRTDEVELTAADAILPGNCRTYTASIPCSSETIRVGPKMDLTFEFPPEFELDKDDLSPPSAEYMGLRLRKRLGQWRPPLGTRYPTIPVECVGGACCMTDGACEVAPSASECDGEFDEGRDCATKVCRSPQACCISETECTDLTEAACEEQGGRPQGFESTCAEADCALPREVCCQADGACTLDTRAACEAGGGIRYAGDSCDGVQCTLVPCCTERGCGMRRADLCDARAVSSCDECERCCFPEVPACAFASAAVCQGVGGLSAAGITSALECLELCASVPCHDEPVDDEPLYELAEEAMPVGDPLPPTGQCASQAPTDGSAGTSQKAGAGDATEVHVYGAAEYADVSDTHLGEAFENTLFPCGSSERGYTLCPSVTRMPAGDYYLIYSVLKGTVPLSDPTSFYTYAFVFDGDGDPQNDFEPLPDYPFDFFQATDRWYEAKYDPTAGWSLKVSEVVDNDPADASTAARIILRDNVVALIVPASEFLTPRPRYRVTAFRHAGDFGLNPPFDWNGDVEPPVDVGLATFAQ
ncbi:MAG: hypothetical protein PVI30_10610 [Myxococcales bacterium]|jgi:hypothetical protein